MRSQTIILKRARRMRQALSPPEVALWVQLKGRRLEGYAFRRQHPFGRFILDFYCEAAKLAIEVDGYVHGTGHAAARDEQRDSWLREQGLEVLRLSASLVLDDMPAALATILAVVRRRAPSVASRPLPRAEHGGGY